MTVDLVGLLLPALGSLAFGGAVGGVLGWVLKKVAKLVAVLVTLFIVAPLGYLAYRGVITVNWTALYSLLAEAGTWLVQAGSALVGSLTIAVPGLAGFTTGFVVGFQKG